MCPEVVHCTGSHGTRFRGVPLDGVWELLALHSRDHGSRSLFELDIQDHDGCAMHCAHWQLAPLPLSLPSGRSFQHVAYKGHIGHVFRARIVLVSPKKRLSVTTVSHRGLSSTLVVDNDVQVAQLTQRTICKRP
jgi:hypothetical protein